MRPSKSVCGAGSIMTTVEVFRDIPCFLLLLCFCSFTVGLCAGPGGAPVCLTCLRPDSLNAEVSCWQDRKTVAVNCSEPMHRCAELLLRGSPDFLALRKSCQPTSVVHDPCLYIEGTSYRVAGSQPYTVNGEPDKCVCLDLCNPASHVDLFPSAVRASTKLATPSTEPPCNCTIEKSDAMVLDDSGLGAPDVPWDLEMDSAHPPAHMTDKTVSNSRNWPTLRGLLEI